MKRTEPKIDQLLNLARQAPAAVLPGIRPGYASRVARIAFEQGKGSRTDEAFAAAFRWAILSCAAVTVIIAALNAPTVVSNQFAPDVAFESHISEWVLGQNR